MTSSHDRLTAVCTAAWTAPKDAKTASSMIRWTIAFAVSAKRVLRAEKDYHDLDGILTRAEIDKKGEHQEGGAW